jgi:hypothetical protein
MLYHIYLCLDFFLIRLEYFFFFLDYKIYLSSIRYLFERFKKTIPMVFSYFCSSCLERRILFFCIISYTRDTLIFVQTTKHAFNLFYNYIPKCCTLCIFQSTLFQPLMITCIIRDQIFTYMYLMS